MTGEKTSWTILRYRIGAVTLVTMERSYMAGAGEWLFTHYNGIVLMDIY